MKYQIIFTHQSNGVWARHETLELAQQHIKVLVGTCFGHTNWTIFHEGKEVKSSNGGVAQR